MPLLTIEQCRRQCRVDGDYDDDLLSELLGSAEDSAAAYINRAVFPDQSALAAALAELPAGAAAAAEEYASAIAAAASESNSEMAKAMVEVALAKRDALALARNRVLHGIVVNGSVVAAIRLMLGDLYANRENTMVGAVAVEMPAGAKALLRPYRRVMGP